MPESISSESAGYLGERHTSLSKVTSIEAMPPEILLCDNHRSRSRSMHQNDPETQGDQSPMRGEPLVQDQSTILPLKKMIFVFAGCSCALFSSWLEQTIVSTAVPTIGSVFGDTTIASWIGTAYLLASVACQPLYGRFSDIFGRKTIIQGSMLIFLVGSILCGTSKSMIALIIFRALTGMGGGGVLTCVNIIVGDIVSPQERGQWEGILGAVCATANAIGPLLGGLFAEKVSWRWCFYITVPLTAISIFVVAFGLPLKGVKGEMKDKLKKIDYMGCFLVTSSATLILVPLSLAGAIYAWSSATVLAPLVLGFGLIPVFIYVELKRAILPVVPFRIFKNSSTAGIIIGSFFTGFTTYGNLYYLPQFYQVVHGANPFQSGVLLVPLVVTQTLTSLTTGLIVTKSGNYFWQLVSGFAIWTIASGLLSTTTPDISDAKMIGYQIMSGIGSGQTFMTGLIAIQATVSREDLAVASGMRNFMRMLGGTIALAACSAILNNTFRQQASGSLPADLISEIAADPTRATKHGGLTGEQVAIILEAYCQGIRNIYYLLVSCCGVSFLVTVLMVKNTSLGRKGDVTPEREPDETSSRSTQNAAQREK